MLSKYLRTQDLDLLNESYDIQIAKYMAKVPPTTADAVRSVLEELAERNPRAKDANPARFFDDRFVRQLQATGLSILYIDKKADDAAFPYLLPCGIGTGDETLGRAPTEPMLVKTTG